MRKSPGPSRRSGLRRSSRLAPSRKPLKARGATKAKKEARYKAFLSSGVWKRLRKEALVRAGNQCERTLYSFCGRFTLRCCATEKLAVHHVTYARFGGEEQPCDLQVLCKQCHDTVHALSPL